MLSREPVGVFGSAAPDSNLFELRDARERGEMRLGLHAAPEQPEHFAVWRHEVFRDGGRGGGRWVFRDQASGDGSQRLAIIGTEEQNDRLMRRNGAPFIGGIKADGLEAH